MRKKDSPSNCYLLKALVLGGTVLIATQTFAQGQSPTAPPTLESSPGNEPGERSQNPANAAERISRTTNYRVEPANNDGAGKQDLAKLIDQHLAACLILDNQEARALGYQARESASSDQVKRFALMMIDDHTKALAQLKDFAAGNTASESSQLNTRTNRKTGVNRSEPGFEAHNEFSQGTTSALEFGNQLITIREEVKRQSLELTKRELEAKRGTEFDQAYLGQQMAGQLEMAAALTAFEHYASPGFEKVISEQNRTTVQHLNQIRQLIEKDLDGAAKSSK